MRQEESIDKRVQFIQTELELALAFLDIAATTRSDQIRALNVENAQKAHRAVLRFLKDELECTAEQRKSIKRALTTLSKRLAGVRDFLPLERR